jgi:sugar/nucleoside kinase (ribokinase family)
MMDIVGIGALNVDYIVGRTMLKDAGSQFAGEIAKSFGDGPAKPVDRPYIDEVLNRLGGRCQRTFGGSAFYVIRTLVALDAGLRLGFVGALSVNQDPGVDFSQWFASHGVDHRFVQSFDGGRQGICVSLVTRGDRQLIANSGINGRLAEILKSRRDDLIEYLAQARIIHFVSSLDDESPVHLLSILSAVKQRNPSVHISFDPGYVWASSPTNSIDALYKRADILFVNQKEFEEIGKRLPPDEDIDVARRIIDKLAPNAMIMLLKRYDEITAFLKLADRLVEYHYPTHTLEASEIEDATGAGDVFAGGFLAGQLQPAFHHLTQHPNGRTACANETLAAERGQLFQIRLGISRIDRRYFQSVQIRHGRCGHDEITREAPERSAAALRRRCLGGSYREPRNHLRLLRRARGVGVVRHGWGGNGSRRVGFAAVLSIEGAIPFASLVAFRGGSYWIGRDDVDGDRRRRAGLDHCHNVGGGGPGGGRGDQIAFRGSRASSAA